MDPLKALEILLKYLTSAQRIGEGAPGGGSWLNAGACDADYEEAPADAALLQEWVGWLDMMMKIWEVCEDKRNNILAPLRDKAQPTEDVTAE